jgi:hypothetical protein
VQKSPVLHSPWLSAEAILLQPGPGVDLGEGFRRKGLKGTTRTFLFGGSSFIYSLDTFINTNFSRENVSLNKAV